MAKESEGVLSPRDVPDEYICSITFEIMEDPVFAMDGHSYERSAIEDWFTKNNRSPLTNEVIETRVVPNHNLKSIIAAHRDSYSAQQKQRRDAEAEIQRLEERLAQCDHSASAQECSINPLQ